MSRTNRDPDDYTACWYTDPDVARAACWRLVRVGLLRDGMSVLEPHVGGGAWLDGLYSIQHKLGWRFEVVAIDVDPGARGLASVRLFFEGGRAYRGNARDYMKVWERQGRRFDLVLGNPPFSVVVEKANGDETTQFVGHSHIKAAIAVADTVAMEVPLGIARTIDRRDWSTRYPAKMHWPICPRPPHGRVLEDGRISYKGGDNAHYDIRVWTQKALDVVEPVADEPLGVPNPWNLWYRDCPSPDMSAAVRNLEGDAPANFQHPQLR